MGVVSLSNEQSNQQQQFTTTKRDRRIVRILNPPAGGAEFIKYSKALKYIRRHRAVFTDNGCLRFIYDGVEVRRLKNLRNGAPVVVSEFSGLDAAPGRAVLPPSLEYMRREYGPPGIYRGPLRPPLRSV